jgi:hypothetical protein
MTDEKEGWYLVEDRVLDGVHHELDCRGRGRRLRSVLGAQKEANVDRERTLLCVGRRRVMRVHPETRDRVGR